MVIQRKWIKGYKKFQSNLWMLREGKGLFLFYLKPGHWQGGSGTHPASGVLSSSRTMVVCSMGVSRQTLQDLRVVQRNEAVKIQGVIKGLRITCTHINMNNFFNWLHGDYAVPYTLEGEVSCRPCCSTSWESVSLRRLRNKVFPL